MSKTNKTQMPKAQSQSKALKAAQQFLFRKQKSILSAAFLIMGLSLASRILGLVRDRLLAAYFGSGPDLAAYLAAFRLPDFIFQVLIFGTITVSFIPIFTDLSQNKKPKNSGARLVTLLISPFYSLWQFLWFVLSLLSHLLL